MCIHVYVYVYMTLYLYDYFYYYANHVMLERLITCMFVSMVMILNWCMVHGFGFGALIKWT